MLPNILLFSIHWVLEFERQFLWFFYSSYVPRLWILDFVHLLFMLEFICTQTIIFGYLILGAVVFLQFSFCQIDVAAQRFWLIEE